MRIYISDMPFAGTEISPNQLKSINGTLFCTNVRFARTGVQYYLGRELGLIDRADEKIKVYRLAEDVFNPASMQTFEAVDLTDDHPAGDMVTTDNYLQYSRGHVQNVRPDGIYLSGDLAVKASSLISKVEGGKRQISAGYWCDYEPYKDGFKQTNIVANHIAVVDKGRAGDKVLIRDEDSITENGEILMQQYTAEQVAQLFNAQATKDSAPAPVAQASSNDTLLSKMLDHLLGSSKAKPAKDEDDDKDEEKKKKEMADAALAAMIAKAVSDAVDKKLASRDEDDDEDEDKEKKKAEDTAKAILEALDSDDEDDDKDEDDKKESKDAEYKAARDALKPFLVDMSPKKQKQAKDALRVKFGKQPTSDAYLQIAKHVKDSESINNGIDEASIAESIRKRNPNYASK